MSLGPPVWKVRRELGRLSQQLRAVLEFFYEPFLRWQHFDGAMKFERNAPYTLVDELELGLEWQPMPALELTAIYALTDRTNVIDLPYEQYEGDLLRLQLQWNY
jgi:hypothetical protein